jgi:hypothetical protein
MSTSLFEIFSEFLGAQASDARLNAVLKSLGIVRRPMVPDFFKSPYEVVFPLSKYGLQLSFQDENYFHRAPARRRGQGELILRSVVAVADSDSMAGYSGDLPFTLTWGDTPASTRTKMLAAGERAGHLHGGQRDSWWLSDRYMSVTYQHKAWSNQQINEGLGELVRGLFLPPSQASHGLQPADYPSSANIVSCFGKSGKSTQIQSTFHAFDPLDWSDDTHLDFSDSFGLEVYFDASRVTADGSPAFVGVNLKRDRLGSSTAWLGELPLNLSWDDSIDEVIKRIGRQPEQQELDFETWGWAKWFECDHLLWVNFDTLRNRLESIALMDLSYENTRA